MYVNVCSLQWILSGPTNLLANLNLRFPLLESLRPTYKIIHITINNISYDEFSGGGGVVILPPPLFRALVQYFRQSIYNSGNRTLGRKLKNICPQKWLTFRGEHILNSNYIIIWANLFIYLLVYLFYGWLR